MNLKHIMFKSKLGLTVQQAVGIAIILISGVNRQPTENLKNTKLRAVSLCQNSPATETKFVKFSGTSFAVSGDSIQGKSRCIHFCIYQESLGKRFKKKSAIAFLA